MYYVLAKVCKPILIEQIGDYSIKYDDYVFYSVWYGKRCLLENASLVNARDFCIKRIDINGEIVVVLNTYFLSIKGECFSKYIDQTCWHRRYHAPWIGFFPIPQRVDKRTLLYERLFKDFIEAEKNGEISHRFKKYFSQQERDRYNRV
ncbi:hypothetical protein HP567_028940 [Brevibacillus sp. M2.1A]|uniref:hypothetical protein n=1 Tax=Brevibacillus sp. M2.1A TaxID=2738980 RepID=UPI00156B3A67|nr:hypothetical protein [Brevibacillus sp. M2.1A]MCC8438565.1 hypothetical protein [Brevibacillus sp. M2.1A]